ncbi:MAG: Calx-beta domain-containing protein, partial [Planctomycetota bacterium]
TEGGSPTTMDFTVRLSKPPTSPVIVNYATAPGTALEGADYTPLQGSIVFSPTDPLSKTVSVPIIDDNLSEFPETFSLLLTGCTGASIARSAATGMILDDDTLAQTATSVGAVPILDTDQDVITITLKGPGRRTVYQDAATGAITGVELRGTTAASSLVIAVKKSKTGDGRVALGDIHLVDGSLKSLSAAKVDLLGDLTAPRGAIGTLALGNFVGGADHVLQMAGDPKLPLVKVTLGLANNLTVTMPYVALGLFQVVDWDDSGGAVDSLTAARIDTLKVVGGKTGPVGDFDASLYLDPHAPSGSLWSSIALKVASIAGSVTSDTWGIQTNVGKVSIRRDLTSTEWMIDGYITSLTIGGWAAGASSTNPFQLRANSITTATVGGARWADFLCGVNEGLRRPAKGSDFNNNSPGGVGTFTVAGIKGMAAATRFFVDSNVAGVGRANLLNIDIEQPQGIAFGLFSYYYFGPVTWKDLANPKDPVLNGTWSGLFQFRPGDADLRFQAGLQYVV